MASLEQFTSMLYKDDKYNNPPYDQWARGLSLENFIWVAMVTISYHILQAFATYIALIP